MIPLDVLTVFFAASVALGLAPGPDNIFVLTQSALYGRLAGFIVTLGLATGLIFHTSAVALGVAAVFAASEAAFTALKLVGAGYLLYLAWQAFRAGASKLPENGAPEIGYGKLYVRGVIMNVTNPKVGIFFLAFLPQFADPARGSIALQMLMLGAVFIVATLLVFGSVAVFGGLISDLLKRSERAQIWMNRAAGLVFVGLAVRLATAER